MPAPCLYRALLRRGAACRGAPRHVPGLSSEISDGQGALPRLKVFNVVNVGGSGCARARAHPGENYQTIG